MKTTDNQLVIAVSSRALFDLEEEHLLFEEKGIAAYREYQLKNIDTPLNPGVAFAFIERLLKLNELFPEQEPFRVVVLSRNSPETGQRFFSSCRHYNLPIKAGAFTSGQSTFPYLQAFDASLFLSANKENVMRAIRLGQPAGLVLPVASKTRGNDDDGNELRIAFDFDGVIIDDEAEREFQKEGLSGFQRFEITNKETPHGPGPLHKLFTKLAQFQALDAERGKNDPYYKPAIRISIVTARGAPSEQRLITTLKSLGMSAAELFLLDGLPKNRILDALQPHIFFDDQLRHLELTSKNIPSVLVPFGITNVADHANDSE
ncbi:MAG: 5'-nucleotidase [Sutterellaceae bacterium]|nr:5'-nucleotidase [Sutterellaceae bacterium]